MSLRARLARRRLPILKGEMDKLVAKRSGFDDEEKKLEKDIDELSAESGEEADEELSRSIEDLATRRNSNEDAIAELEKQISEEQACIDAEEEEAREAERAISNGSGRTGNRNGNTGGATSMPIIYTKNKIRSYREASSETRSAILNDEQTQVFIESIRRTINPSRRDNQMPGANQTLTDVDLTIPQVMLPTIRQIVEANSVMLPLVTDFGHIAGEATQNIQIGKNEAVWMDQFDRIMNYLELGWEQVKLGAHQVAALFAVNNATAEDSSENILSLVVDALAQAEAFAFDKAILYGQPGNMPKGIVTTLALTSKPEWWGTKHAWKDVHATNIMKLDYSDTTAADAKDFVRKMIAAKRKAKNKFFKGGFAWVMNEDTRDHIVEMMVGYDYNHAIVAQINDTMPVVGGKIVLIDEDIVQDGDIIFGYFPAYAWATRGTPGAVAKSVDFKFDTNSTVFRRISRADGRPVFAECFGVVNILNQNPKTSATFAGQAQEAAGGNG